jgi:hypothetical protein
MLKRRRLSTETKLVVLLQDYKFEGNDTVLQMSANHIKFSFAFVALWNSFTDMKVSY